MVDAPNPRNDWQHHSNGNNANLRCHPQVQECDQEMDHPYHGHAPAEVPDDWFRLALINIGVLGSKWSLETEKKDEDFCSQLQKYEIEVLLMQEPGVNWSLVPRNYQWLERNKKRFAPNSKQVRFGYNVHDKTGAPFQWGGTGVFSLGKMRQYSMGTGVDSSGLGRWTWA